MPGTSRNLRRSSDRLGTHTESMKVGKTSNVPRDMVVGAIAFQRKIAALKAKGFEPFKNEGLVCACGKTALRTWKNVGWCRKCWEKKGVL